MSIHDAYTVFATAITTVPEEHRKALAKALNAFGHEIIPVDPARGWGLIDAAALVEDIVLVEPG